MGTETPGLRMYSRNKETHMNMEAKKSGRNTLAAVFLGFSMPGLGQIYNGEAVKGISFFILTLTLGIVGIRGTVLLRDSLLIYGTLAVIIAAGVLYLSAVVDAFKQAFKTDVSYQLKSYNRWYFYPAVWLLGFALLWTATGYVRDNYLAAYHIPTSSMEPGVHRGDSVLADKTAYRRMPPKKGDVVVFINPDDRSILFCKRIEALPGDVVTRPDGTQETVPHGFVYVLGDNRENSTDSRLFGFIPLRDIVAKIRQVYFSSGVQGIQWNRIGTVVGGQ
jgi:signal peptidase I